MDVLIAPTQTPPPTPEEPVQIPAEDRLIRVSAWQLSREGGPQQARRLLRSHVAEHVDGPALDEADVVVSELATNAFVHTGGPCELRLVQYAGFPIVYEIADVGDQEDIVAKRLAEALVCPAVADDPDIAHLDEGGFGLSIVAALTKGHCGVRPARLYHSTQAGKGVWFALPALGRRSCGSATSG
ncbi:ATP-binding protein [Microbispora cellulosiformans]|uniref:ATP-binding protein n=1 Tax=Microbispora cellulosiformans TaxID=2614688 RepID=A0A5J5JUI1_9ACTN|nr:ATP-binding protein [Microbispora cellulosiformans]KAA9374875.1 ATP-binding protein [Microbispora cellulosiformans]